MCRLTVDQAFSKKVCNRKIIYLFLNQNICCWYSKEPSQQDGSFERPKHVLKLMGKKIFAIFMMKICVFLNLFCGPLLFACKIRFSQIQPNLTAKLYFHDLIY